jgi:phospholipid/cholesterol/gamma-HCH transport system substrate-binding protein
LRHIDEVIAENRKSLNTAITGIGTFADMLGRNSDRIDEMLGGLEKLLGGGGGSKNQPAVYDLTAAADFPKFDKKLEGQIAIPDPQAILVFDSQKVLVRLADGTHSNVENAQWADNLPKLMQAKIVQSFENADQLRSVSRRIDDLNANYRLAIEIRSFEVTLSPEPTAVVEFAARILSEDGKVTEAKMFKATAPAKSKEVGDAVPALNQAFAQAAKDLVVWTVGSL